MIENPQSFIVSTECSKATKQHGFRRRLGETDGWAAFQSTTAQGTIWLAAEGPAGPWFLALDHTGVIEELCLSAVAMPGPGRSIYTFETLGQIYGVLSRIYQLASSLPDAPLREFQTKIKELPMTTETERLIVQRIGQDIFRASLIEYWQGRCPMTGIDDLVLLRASHIIPWAKCKNDEQRLDVHNGLLLSALWDVAFDNGFVTFDDLGQPVFSSQLGSAAVACLNWNSPVFLTDKHRRNLEWHREYIFK